MDETTEGDGGRDDPGCETYRTSYESGRDRPSIALVEAIAGMKGTAPTALEPLGSTIEMDALDSVLRSLSDGGVVRIAMPSYGVRATIDSDGTIELRPTDPEPPGAEAGEE